MNRIIILLTIFATIILMGCNNEKNKRNKDNTNVKIREELKIKEYSFENPPKFRKDGELNFVNKNTGEVLLKIDVEIASTDVDKARGLMYRSSMEENQGMLFLMDREEIQSFYMRNTIIPLDIIYVNSKFEIVDIYKNTKILDETSLPSKAPARYIVEINGGLCDKFNIKEGDKIAF